MLFKNSVAGVCHACFISMQNYNFRFISANVKNEKGARFEIKMLNLQVGVPCRRQRPDACAWAVLTPMPGYLTVEKLYCNMNLITPLLLAAAIAASTVTAASAGTKKTNAKTAGKPTAACRAGLESINIEAARAHVGFLADDALEGRRAGQRGSRVAQQYIISQLRMAGVKPLYDAYLHGFEAYSLSRFKRKPYYVEADSVAKIKPLTHRKLSLGNVLAMIPGKKSDEYVVVGAHLDHEGVDTELDGDQIYNGADDNASGVSAVLQIAKAFAEGGATPERNVIFAFWDGEEYGLLGSRHFVETFSGMGNVKGYLNFDMVGGNNRPDDPPYMVYFYTASHPVFGDWLKNDIAANGFNLNPSYRAWDNPTGGSDQGSFAKKNIPIIWYHTDAQPNYNEPTDEPATLNYEKLTDITRAAFLSAWHLANETEY